MTDAPPCPKHPDRPLIGTCSRCGTYVCIVCAPELATHPEDPCEPCKAIIKVQDAPRARAAMLNAAGIGGVLYGLTFFGLLAASLTDAREQAVAGVIAAVPLILGAVMWFTKLRPVGYVLTVVEGVLALLIFPSRATLIFLVFAVFTWRMTARSKDDAAVSASAARPGSP